VSDVQPNNKGKALMAYSLKKMWTAMAVTLTAASSLVNAATYSNYPSFDPSGCPSPCPPVNCCGTGNYGSWYFDGEALFLRACEDGLAFATRTNVTTNPTTGSTFAETEVRNPGFRWDVGFRIGVGFNIACCDCWDVSAYWTHFNTRARGHEGDCCESANSFVDPTFGAVFSDRFEDSFFATSPTESVHARWKLDLDLADFDLGRSFCVSQCLTLRPHIGVRYGRVDQKYHVHATESFTLTDTSTSLLIPPTIAATDTRAVRLKSEYEGAGLRAGLDTEWSLGCGLSLYGDASFSVLYGRYRVRAEEAADFFVPLDVSAAPFFGTDAFAFHQKDHFCGALAIADACAGIRYKTSFCNDSVFVSINFGWEQHLFFNNNRFDDFAFSSADVGFGDIGVADGASGFGISRGDLGIQGFTLGAKIDF
jgi:hypothetical protein